MASTPRLPGSTSIASDVTPRAWARVTSVRISAAPTPRRCQASATTTPTSVTRAPQGSLGPVRGHGVPDDDAVRDGDYGVDVGGPAGQQVEQAVGGRDRGEEPEIAALDGQSREEVAERGQVRRAHRPDRGGGAAIGSLCLGSVHELSMAGIAESVN